MHHVRVVLCGIHEAPPRPAALAPCWPDFRQFYGDCMSWLPGNENHLVKLRGAGMTDPRMKVALYMGVRLSHEVRYLKRAQALLSSIPDDSDQRLLRAETIDRNPVVGFVSYFFLCKTQKHMKNFPPKSTRDRQKRCCEEVLVHSLSNTEQHVHLYE